MNVNMRTIMGTVAKLLQIAEPRNYALGGRWVGETLGWVHTSFYVYNSVQKRRGYSYVYTGDIPLELNRTIFFTLNAT